MISVFLTDDHVVVRQGIRALIERERDIRVTGEAGDGAGTMAQLAALRPDVLLLDLMLPDMGGLEVLQRAKAALPQLHVVILSMHDNKVHLLASLQRGAEGYVMKGNSGAELLQAMRAVMIGRRYVSPALAEHLLEGMAGRRCRDQASSACLTPREEQVLCFTSEGLSSSDIARRLGISSRTVEAHRNNLMKKLGLHNKAELIRYALEHSAPSHA